MHCGLTACHVSYCKWYVAASGALHHIFLQSSSHFVHTDFCLLAVVDIGQTVLERNRRVWRGKESLFPATRFCSLSIA